MHNVITLIAQDFIIVPIILALVVWVRLELQLKKNFVLVGIIGAVVTLALALIGSKLFNDPRPFVVGHFTPYFPHGADNGFPSDHTLLGSLLAFLTYKYNRTLGTLALIIALAVGIARVFAGIHHMGDIIGAVAFAAIGIVVGSLIVDRLNKAGPLLDSKHSQT
jgi:undecaprenyl-diphosphatase